MLFGPHLWCDVSGSEPWRRPVLANTRAAGNTPYVAHIPRYHPHLGYPTTGRWSVFGFLCVWVLGCSDLRLWPADPEDDFIGIPPLTAAPPAEALDAAVPLPDGAVACERDEECDDGVDCTTDICLGAGYCRSRADLASCDDGVFCNGVEVCHHELGCLPGRRRDCDDGDVCTLDACDEENKRCRNRPRDFDGDGEVDWHCIGGTDCDDLDATRASEAAEVCSDGVDNDCDDSVDEKTCGRPIHDTCSDPLELEGSGTFVLDLRGVVRDYTVACDKALSRDAVFAFEISEERDVDLTVRGLLRDGSEEVATVAVRRDCDVFDDDVECRIGFPAHVRMRALSPGRYYAIVDSPRARRVVLDADFRPPTEPPENTDCDRAVDVGEGGRFVGSFVDLPDNFVAPCGASAAEDEEERLHRADLVYRFTTDEPRDVLISMLSVTDEPVTFSVRSDCEDPAAVLRCAQSSPAVGRLHELPAGTYFVIVETPSVHEVDFELDVRFESPTPAPVGDRCETAVPLAFGEPELGTLTAKQDDVATSCQLFSPDTVYSLTVEEPTDLDIKVDGADSPMRFALQRECGVEKSELVCDQGRPARIRLRDVAPGEYFLTVESNETQQFELTVELLERTQPELVSGNDLCGSAVQVPQEGGLFRGSTASLLNDYVACGNSRSRDAAFRLELTQERTVTASVEAAFDTVLYRYMGEGVGACEGDGPVESCDDDSLFGSNSRLQSERLKPGTHFYIVDGFSDSNSGEYVFEVLVDD